MRSFWTGLHGFQDQRRIGRRITRRELRQLQEVAGVGNHGGEGFELVDGCKVLIDAEAMRPVALIDLDPGATASEADPPAPCGFNPYWDLSPT